MFVYVGALTSGDPSGSNATGISVLNLDTSTGALTHLQTLEGLQNPSFLVVHPEQAVIYTGERYTSVFGPGEALNGAITSLRVGADGRLSVLDRQPSGGPAYVNIHPTGRYVFVAIPRSYCIMAYPVAADGRVEPASGIVQHHGRGVNPSTWQAPYPHSVFPDRLGKRVLACDMGLDRIMLHDFDMETGRLQPATPHAFAQLSSGAGPRHLAVHPNGEFVYTVNELSSTMSAFAYDADSGMMRIRATLSTMPGGFRRAQFGSTNPGPSVGAVCLHLQSRPQQHCALFAGRRQRSAEAGGLDLESGADSSQFQYRSDGAVHAGRQPALGQCRELPNRRDNR